MNANRLEFVLLGDLDVARVYELVVARQVKDRIVHLAVDVLSAVLDYEIALLALQLS